MRLPVLPKTPLSDAPPLWPPLLATLGPGRSSARHAHHALHLIVATSGVLRAIGPGDEAPIAAAGILTAPDALHGIDAAGVDVLIVFFDAESGVGARLSATTTNGVRRLSDHERQLLLVGADPAALMSADGAAWAERAVAILEGGTPRRPRTIHPRVRQAIRLLRELPVGSDTSLKGLALAVGLSEGRLMHAFTESVGIPLRPYLTWLKLQRAASAVAAGHPLSRAAHAAGFADAAHMTRVFRRMLGVTPSALSPVPAEAARVTSR